MEKRNLKTMKVKLSDLLYLAIVYAFVFAHNIIITNTDTTILICSFCDIPAQGLIGLIEYSYHQSIPSSLEAHLHGTPRLSVLDPEQFQDG
jgi:hypothetical protein